MRVYTEVELGAPATGPGAYPALRPRAGQHGAERQRWGPGCAWLSV
ncbi:MAG: hypothetical protein AAGC55_32490 [Myxococcota bacterium]